MGIIFLILCTLCAVIISKLISIIYNQTVIWRKVKHIPKIEGYLFVGAALKLMRMSYNERIKWYLSQSGKFKEGLFLQWLGNQLEIHVFKPEALQIILPSTVNINKASPYELLQSWLGNGLITSTGLQWFHNRKLIGPTFHFSILEQFALVQSEKAEILTKCIEKEIKKKTAIDIFSLINNASLDIICETAMGVNIHAQENDSSSEYIQAQHRITKLITDRAIQPWYWPNWIFDRTPMGKEYKSLISIVHKFTKEVINEKTRRRKLQTDNIKTENENDELDIDKRKKKAFLDVLLDENEKADKPLTNDELKEQVETFMFGGQDTTSIAITWVLFVLGNNLDHQEKVHEELDKVFQNSDVPASLKELSELKYLDRVIKEVLRLYPSIPLIGRKLVEDVQIGRYTLPKDTTLIVSIILTHHNPEVWPDPEKFDPDRFLPENSQHRNPYAYIPFSAGPRNCIGQRFAQFEEKIILTAILRKWRVKSVKTAISYGMSIVTRPLEPVSIHFTSK